MVMSKKNIHIVGTKNNGPLLGRNFLAVIVANCNGCWALIDDQRSVCPRCGKNPFTGRAPA